MHGSSCDVQQPKYGGKIIDIVSRDVRRPEDKAQALEDVKGTILYIVTIVLVGYLSFSEKVDFEKSSEMLCTQTLQACVFSPFCLSDQVMLQSYFVILIKPYSLNTFSFFFLNRYVL
jgi:hypothetical protein